MLTEMALACSVSTAETLRFGYRCTATVQVNTGLPLHATRHSTLACRSLTPQTPLRSPPAILPIHRTSSIHRSPLTLRRGDRIRTSPAQTRLAGREAHSIAALTHCVPQSAASMSPYTNSRVEWVAIRHKISILDLRIPCSPVHRQACLARKTGVQINRALCNAECACCT
ncbi:hypothetical protein BDW22DRAFT_1000933 [Trametopsis cervina]|nr:hypothetical protein BDW22DRAFT_1000933 [Trametopsis cervina]